MSLRITTVVLIAWLGAVVRTAPAQSLGASREALQQRLADLTAAAAARDSNAAARARASVAAAAVSARLQDGDFQPGDRVVLRVEGPDAPAAERTPVGATRSVEQQVSDTFTVGTDRGILLPVWGAISLRGVLRAELEPYLTREVGRFVHDPVVHARALLRVSVVGGVARPGFYAVPADAVLSDALMAAGGPVAEAKVEDLRIERAGAPLWTGAGLQLALAEGRTLDDLNLRAGDRFVVPLGGRHSSYETVRTIGVLLGIPLTIYSLTRIF